MAFGAGIGTSIEAKYKQEGKIRPLTKEEQRERKLAIMFGVGLLLLGIIALITILVV